MFAGFGGLKKNTSFHNVRVDSGSYKFMDMDVGKNGSVNDISEGDVILLNDNNHTVQKFKNLSVSSLAFSSPFLETTWTTHNIIFFVICMLFQTFMPFYWKISDQIYNYPLTSLCIQLFIAILSLFIYNAIFFHCFFKYHPLALTIPKTSKEDNSGGAANTITTNAYAYVPDLSSWANLFQTSSGKKSSGQPSDNVSPIQALNTHFFKHFFNKFMLKWRLVILPSACFALNVVVYAAAISKGSYDFHVLLRATSMIWFVAGSPFLVTDYPSQSTIVAAVLITFGAVFFSWTSIGHSDSSFTIITCNLLSAFFHPFEILFLRRSVRILCMEESETRMIDGIDVMTKAEMALLYLFLSIFVLLPFQLIIEGSEAWNHLNAGFGSHCNWIVIFVGSLWILLRKLNLVFLTSNVEPILVGVGQQSIELWKYIIALFFGGVTLSVCGCLEDQSNDGDQCTEMHNKYPICPCFESPENIFIGDSVMMHWFGLLFIILGFIFYCYLKAKNFHVTNVNIFKFNR